jgi:ATP-binding cassette subfamily B (MDR/TAP) protein 1
LKAGIIPSMAVIVITGTAIMNRFSNEAAESTTAARSVAEGAIHAVQVVQAFDAFDPLITEHENHLTQAMKSGTKKSIASAMLLGSVFFIALVILQELVKKQL